jgi:GntR family carbon starvation induced transcriptional regulator
MAGSRPRQVTNDNLVYERIRDDLLSGHYEPGSKLRIEDLSAHYEFGVSPIREALSRLAEAGLINYAAQRGYRVAAQSPEEYADLVSMRLMLEPEALFRAIRAGDLNWEADVAAAYHRLSRMQAEMADGSAEAYRGWARADRSFHLALIASCPSRWLLTFCRMIIEQTARYHRAQIMAGTLPIHRTGIEHKALLDFVMARDVDGACQALREHIQAVADRILGGACLSQQSDERTRKS